MTLTFPEFLPPLCLAWAYPKRSKFSTILQRPMTMRRPASATVQRGVIYELELKYEFLKNDGRDYEDDLAYVQCFYEACRGGYGWFVFDPSTYNLEEMSVTPDANSLRSGFFGIGDGSTTMFQLWRSTNALGGGTVTLCEMIQHIDFKPVVYADGTAVDMANYSFSNYPATVTFTTAPAANAVLTWEGKYKYLCRFAEDTLEPEEFMYRLWELKSLKLETVNL